MRCDDDTSEWLSIKQGVRHLIALYTEMIMRDMEGFRIGVTVVNNRRYAYDTVIVAESEEQLQHLNNVVAAKSEEKGLHLNSANSFSIVLSQTKTTHTCHIDVPGNILETSTVVHLIGKFVLLRCKM